MGLQKAFGILFVEGVLCTLFIPAIAFLRLRTGFLVLLGIGGAGIGASWFFSSSLACLPALLGAQAVLLAFFLFLLGLSRLLTRPGNSGLAVLAPLLGLALLASPFLTDPLLEDTHGDVRPWVREVTLAVNPAAAMASPSLMAVDWLRMPMVYKRLTLGQFHAYRYPTPWIQGLVFFLLGGILLLLGRA